MKNFCINLENGYCFVYEVTLESMYLQGRFGGIPIIEGKEPERPQFLHHAMIIENPKKLAKQLRLMADKIEKGEQ